MSTQPSLRLAATFAYLRYCMERSLVHIGRNFISLLDGKAIDELGVQRDLYANLIFWSTFTVVLGCAMEIPEVLVELWPSLLVHKWERRIKAVSSLGLLLVVLGVSGELVFDHFRSAYDGLLGELENIQLLDAEERLLLTEKDAGDAEHSASAAAAAADRANDLSDHAGALAGRADLLARNARIEADLYKNEIVSAKEQAASAVSRLADAEQRLAAATEREARAETVLNQLRTPRSITNIKQLVDSLRPFGGTEFTLNSFMDDESMQFTVQVADVLQQAGWIRKQPRSMNIGVPTLKINFRNGSAELVPSCVNSGLSLHIRTMQSLTYLQSLPVQALPQNVRAGLALTSAAANRISPADDRNIAVGVIDPEPGDGFTICVGKKP